MKELLELCHRLEERIAFLEADDLLLRNTILQLTEENASLKRKNAQLSERLGLNSKNSSLPSSKEMYKIKRNKPTSKRKVGGQPGHKGITRNMMIADEIIPVPLKESVCFCGGNLSISKQPYIKQIVDLPVIKPHVIEYHIEHGRCNKCGKRSNSSSSINDDIFGPRIKSSIASLTAFYKNSKRDVQCILKDLFHLEISLGSISNSERRVSAKCSDHYQNIEQSVNASSIIHIDETSHYSKAKMGWCWLFASACHSFLKIAETRGKKVLEQSIFGPDDSIIVTDRYAAYNYFNEDKRQVCWAHLARDFERFANSYNIEVKKLGLELGQITRELFALHKNLRSEQIGLVFFLRRAQKLRRRMWRYLREIPDIPDVIGASRVAKNIMKSESMMWRFLDAPLIIPMTNNHAEQQIRHFVMYRKNSYFTQSKSGEQFLERLVSLYLTCKKQSQKPFDTLLSLVAQPVA